jgi:hypothetical protein
LEALPKALSCAAETWGGRAWAGAALYVALFAAAILGVRVLVLCAPGGEERP